MKYCFDLKLDLQNNVRNTIRHQIERSITRLSDKSLDKTAVHETRKAIKRIRALLKLVQPGLGDALYRRENARFRQIAHGLSETRDHDILTDALHTLENFQKTKPVPAITRVQKVVKACHPLRDQKSATAMRAAKLALQEAHHVYDTILISDNEPETLKLGLAASYRSARRAQKTAYKTNDDDAFHDWRKPVQVHWRQMALFWQAWPAEFDARIAMAKTLSQNLGEDHDLKILMKFLDQNGDTDELKPHDAEKIARIARACQQDLRLKSRPLAELLFQERPEPHAKRIIGLWRAARAASGPVAASVQTTGMPMRPSTSPAPATTDAS